jgi:PAS domain S-box-containing protein
VRASNNDGVWNEEGVSLRIHVTPRWYERPIVPLVALALVAVAGVARYRWRVRALREREKELSRRVDERTSELHRLNEDLENRVRIRTAELAAEKERLAVTLRSIGDGVIATDVEGRIVLMNRIAETLTGWSLAEAEGEPLTRVLDVIDQTSRKPPPDPVAAIVSGREWALPTRSLLRRRDGTDALIADSVAAIRDSGSRIVGVVLVFRDVTESRKVEEQLQNAQKLEGLGVLAGGIAHDFNNLLMGIFGYLSMAERHSDDPRRTREDLERAASVLERARGLTRQLLTFSQEKPPDIVPLALDGLLRNAVQFALSGSNVHCAPDIDADLWPCRGDEQQIGQVVDNLLLNARQAMPRGGEIRLLADNVAVPDEVRLPLEAGRYVRVRIQDSGPGIPPDLLPRIFEPFFTTKVTGSGLGLATAYSIVSQHGGYIDVSSQVGGGTTFSVYLPASGDSDIAGEAPPESGKTPAGQAAARRVLVLDDEDCVREIVRDAVQELGHEVEAVTAGDEAVEAYRAAREAGAPFDLVILDLTIPGGMGGVETLSRLRRLEPAVRAIASSGYSGDPAMIDPEAHGFAGRLAKPYTVLELEDVVTRVLGGEGL